MSHARSRRDTGALEIGFLADSVLRALKALRRRDLTSEQAECLREAHDLLLGLSSNVGSFAPQDTRLALHSVNSFRYAADAIRAIPKKEMKVGLRKHFALMSATLEQVVAGKEVTEPEIESVDQFFRGMSEATFERWSIPPAAKGRAREFS